MSISEKQPLTISNDKTEDNSDYNEKSIEKEENKDGKETKNEEMVERNKQSKKEDVKGIYLNRTSLKEENIDDFIDFIKASKLNAVVMDIKDDYGKLTYDSNIDMVNEIGADSSPPIQDLKSFIQRLKEEDIYTIGRIVVFKDPYLVEKKQEYAIKRNDGSVWADAAGVKWVDPYKQETWNYIINIAKEAAENGIDEVQYDYIRFPENAKKVDQEVTYDNPENMKKEDLIKNFLKFSKNNLKDQQVFISADVFGLVTSTADDMGIGQKWEKVATNLDFISPMTYPSHYAPNTYGIGNPDAHPYEVMKMAIQDAKEKNEKLKQDGKEPAMIRPWIQDFDYKRAYTKEDVKNQMKALEDQGIQQYLIWNAQNVYTKEAFK